MIAGCFVVVWTAPLSAAFWKNISPEDLALERPRLDPDAGVEVLFRETEIDDTPDETTRYHTYVRLKVFDARGVTALEKIEIGETRDAPVINLTARVIRPDGTIVDVSRATIFARDLVRRGSRRVRTKAFSPPALEPGCIVEYQWEEISENSIGGLQLYFQDRFPAWRVRFRIRPFNYDQRGYQLIPAGFRYDLPPLQRDGQGFYTFEQADVPAVRDEPWMPPDDMVQSWMVLYFLRKGQSAPEFWKETGRALAGETSRLTRPVRAIETRASALLAGALDDEERLRRLAAFCRDEIANLSVRPAANAPVNRARDSGRRHDAADTLAAREGTAREINVLFLALARAAGFETRLALAADRSQRIVREPLPALFMVPDALAAVRIDGVWRFFDPGHPHLATGQLAWKNEGVVALVCDRHHSGFVETPRSPATASTISRRAHLTLAADGSATGVVAIEHRGHCAAEWREDFHGLTPEQTARRIYDAEIARLPGIELDEFTLATATAADAPVVLSYRVRLPHFATATASRLIFAPAYFQHGLPRAFPAPTREHVIYQPYEYVQADTVEVVLPAGFAWTVASAPAAFALPPALEYRASVAPLPESGGVLWQRVVSHGGMLFPAGTYRLLQQAFDTLHRQDAFTLVAEQE